MDYRARSDSKSLYLIQYHLHFLLLLLLSAYLPSIMASNNGGKRPCPWERPSIDLFDDNIELSFPVRMLYYGRGCTSMIDKHYCSRQDDDYEKKHQTGKLHSAADQCSCPKCPPVRECALITIQTEAGQQLKENLAPVILQRLRGLSKKALTVESATQAVATIDLLKLINASNSKLDRIRDNAHQGAQLLMDAFAEIPQHV